MAWNLGTLSYLAILAMLHRPLMAKMPACHAEVATDVRRYPRQSATRRLAAAAFRCHPSGARGTRHLAPDRGAARPRGADRDGAGSEFQNGGRAARGTTASSEQSLVADRALERGHELRAVAGGI